MPNNLTFNEKRDAAAVAGEMAASRLHDLIQERFQELQAAGETQADVARRLGATQQQVGHWLMEPRNMTIRSVGRLLSALKAHLLFDLDRYEEIEGGNCAPQQVQTTTFVVHQTPLQVYVAPKGGFTLEPTRPTTVQQEFS